MKFKELATYFDAIENVSSRNEITKILSELFTKVSVTEIQQVCYLIQGKIAPGYKNIDFGIAEKMLVKAALVSLKIGKDDFVSLLSKVGDLGTTVEELKKKQGRENEDDISIKEVFEKLEKLAKAGGQGSQEVKITIISDLISKLDALSTRYLLRIPTNTLRLGFSDMTVLDAFSWMVSGDKKLKKRIEEAYHVLPDLGYIGYQLKEKGIESMNHIEPQIFTPILMMRAERLANTDEIIEKIGPCSIESKFDGFRLQVHIKDNQVKLYSRNLEEVSFMYPDIVEGILKEVSVKDGIFEGEAIGYNPKQNCFLPFQETVSRKRKHDVENKAKEIPLKIFIFEALYINGKSLLKEPFEERRKIMATVIPIQKDLQKQVVILAQDTYVTTGEKIEQLFEDAIEKGLEGIMAKKLNGYYQAGARGFNWIKFKKSYNTKIQDTVDCLVMGYDYGKGKRTSFGIGAFLVGVLNEKTQQFESITKIGTGLTDEEWVSLKSRISKDLELDEAPRSYDIDKTMYCDVWIKPSIVIEVKADEITRSPIHTAGRIMKDGIFEKAGYALRFPRLVRFRDDKSPQDTTTVSEIITLFNNQVKNFGE
jgi:DNA ligase-1